jgi:catalase
MAKSTNGRKGKAARSGATTGAGGETHQTASDAHPILTTNFGHPISDNQNSLRGGTRGPTLLEDFILREKIHHFDHERIPERIVHARGSAAHGVFRLTKSLAKYTRAKVLTEVGAQTETFVRFSTVAGGAGSVDTPRDVRGFAVKFYTTEGNWDLVGNNIPVFFIQDAIKFPDLVHSVKMEADRAYPQAASAHDTFWDFVSLMPETTHTVMWAMSDRAIPRSLRMMEGFGVHTFRLVDDNDKATFVKFHWKPRLGLQSTLWDEAARLQGADNDYHRRDLFEAIANGDYPVWDFGVQLIAEDKAQELPFDILDPTKLIPEELVPIQIIGEMTLNRNPDNFFAETEQVAFLPSNMPPGIDVSEDPLLQGRLFSYLDTQLSRLGTPNWHQIPVNSARGCPFANFQRDGQMQMRTPKGRANYEPNSLAEAGENGGPRETPAGYRTHPHHLNGRKARERADTFADHYSQARLFYRSQSGVEQNHMIGAMVFELSKLTLDHIRARVLANLQNVDAGLAQRVAEGLGVELPAAATPAMPVLDMEPSPGLRLIGKYPPTLKGRCVGVLVSDGADGKAVDRVKTAVGDAGADCKIVAVKIGGAKLKGGKMLKADGQLAGTPSVLFDAVAVVASADGAAALAQDADAVDWLATAFKHLKAIGYTPDANPLLVKAHIEKDAGVADVSASAAGFVKQAATRQWSREKPRA